MKIQAKLWWICVLVFVAIFQTSVGIVSDKEYASLPELFRQDNYDQCMLLGDEALYCYFEYQLEPLTIENPTWEIMQEISADPYNYRHDNLRHWICVPVMCINQTGKADNLSELTEAINECYDKKMVNYGLKGTLKHLKCDTNTSKYPLDWVDILAATFFASYITLVLLSTMLEEIAKSWSPEYYQLFTNTNRGRIISSFSLTRNWYRLKSIKGTAEMEYFKPIQGVRFYNIILVIFSHSVLANLILPVMNTKYTETMNSKVANLFLSSGPMSVSTFFFISSSMLTYGIFSQFEQRKLTPKVLIMIYVNRYIRLTPAIATVILFNATWWRHLGSGPNWNTVVGKQYLRCRKNWWTNLLYVNTIIDSDNMCTPTLWYVALDTQYFILILVLLWYLKKYEKYIWYIIGVLLSMNIIATYINNYIYDLEAFNIQRAESVYEMKGIVGNPQWHRQFISVIGNTCGPIIGVAFGYVCYKTKDMELFKKRKTIWEISYYFLTYVPALSVILIPGWYILILQPEYDPVEASIITAIGRPIFILAIGFAIFGSMHGIGDPAAQNRYAEMVYHQFYSEPKDNLNPEREDTDESHSSSQVVDADKGHSFQIEDDGPTKHVMRWPPAYILGRLAFSAYLVHFTLILSRPGTARSPVYISDMHTVYYLLGDLTGSFIVGLILNLFFEMPVSALQKLLIPNESKDLTGDKKEN